MVLMHQWQRFSNNKIAAGLDQYSISRVFARVLIPLYRVRNESTDINQLNTTCEPGLLIAFYTLFKHLTPLSVDCENILIL